MIVRLSEVFGVSRDVPKNYVERSAVDTALLDALTEKKHIVIHGSSKQGKTNLWKNTLNPADYVRITCLNTWGLENIHEALLKAVGYRIERSTTQTHSGGASVHATLTGQLKVPLIGKAEAEGGMEGRFDTERARETAPLDLDLSDVNDVIEALSKAGAPPYLILDDFHYLPPDAQENFAIALKSFHEASDYTFLVVGVWLEENRLLQFNGDLGGRSVSINADRWSVDELTRVISEGERLLNVEFESGFRKELVESVNESVWVVQEACSQACKAAGVLESARLTVRVEGVARDLITQVVNQDSARYRGVLSRFVEGFQQTRLEMYRWIAFSALQLTPDELRSGIPLSQISAVINANHPERPVNAGNITQALKSTASLQVGKLKIKPIVFDYDETDRRLNVVDRGFLLWFEHQNRAELLAELGFPSAESAAP